MTTIREAAGRARGLDPRPRWGRLRGVADDRWRVSDDAGHILGHLHAVPAAEGWRYAAELFQVATRTFESVGEFWTVDEAVDCLRYRR